MINDISFLGVLLGYPANNSVCVCIQDTLYRLVKLRDYIFNNLNRCIMDKERQPPTESKPLLTKTYFNLRWFYSLPHITYTNLAPII